MSNVKFKIKIFTLFSLTLALLFSNVSSLQALSIKNGVVCKKSGLKAKVGSKNYICGKNPYVTPSKLTWMLKQCPETYDLYLESREQYDIFKDLLNSAGAEGKAEAEKLLTGISSLESLMKSQVCKRGR